MRTIVVIPTYNERENLAPLVRAVLAVDSDLDVLIVDDNSPDGTGALAEELAGTNRRIKVLQRPGKLGLGSAYIAGFRLVAITDAKVVEVSTPEMGTTFRLADDDARPHETAELRRSGSAASDSGAIRNHGDDDG